MKDFPSKSSTESDERDSSSNYSEIKEISSKIQSTSSLQPIANKLKLKSKKSTKSHENAPRVTKPTTPKRENICLLGRNSQHYHELSRLTNGQQTKTNQNSTDQSTISIEEQSINIAQPTEEIPSCKESLVYVTVTDNELEDLH